MLRWVLIAFLSLLFFAASGCQEALVWVGASVYQKETKAPETLPGVQIVRAGLDSSPRIRVGYLPTTTLGTVFPGLEELGQHGYRPNWTEKNGIVYTCRAALHIYFITATCYFFIESFAVNIIQLDTTAPGQCG